jgi:hypothetical protein
MRTRIIIDEHYTGSQHSTSFVLNGHTQFFSVSQYTSDVTVVPCCMNSTISTPFLSQKTDALSFLADVCLNFFDFNCSFASTFTNETQVSPPVTRTT